MFTVRLRKRGNSFVVTVPAAQVRRLGLQQGDFVALDLRPALAPDLRDAFEESFRRNEAGFRYLADR